ncbi:MAG: hypothetical protein HY347_02285 [candidate division NC10 bacterium]|nr:hypothetical protein [candidate division NC10 bacterium]
MRQWKKLGMAVVVGIGVLMSAGVFAQQAPIKVVPVWEAVGHHLQFGNDKARVYDVILEPNVPSGIHLHEYDYVLIVLEGGTIRVTFPDGKSQDVEVKTGEWRYQKGGVVHETMSVGPKRVRAIVVELTR